MENIHFVGEWLDCSAPDASLIDPRIVRTRCAAHVARRHLPIRHEYFATLAPDGVIGVMVGSGLAVVLRTLPPRRRVKADLFVREAAGISAAIDIFDRLRDDFRPLRASLYRAQSRDDAAWCGARRAPCAPTEVFFSRSARRAC